VADVLAAQGIETPFEIQGRVLPDALAGQDVLAKAPTGSGKTLAFGIPLVERVDPNGPTPSALVLVPTRELAAQVGEVLEPLAAARGLRVATAYGGVGLHDQAKKADRSHLLVATPGRLEDLANRRMLSLGAVSILVLDEADRMLDMGFQPQVDRIVRRLPQDRQTMFFSATLDGEVGRLARSYTTDPAHHEANPGDETVRLAYADYLDEEASERGEAIPCDRARKEAPAELLFPPLRGCFGISSIDASPRYVRNRSPAHSAGAQSRQRVARRHAEHQSRFPLRRHRRR
jgi:uncharacterized protein (TIGR02996 family)